VFKDGKLPFNVSGGLKAKGHAVYAAGMSQHVIAAIQLATPRKYLARRPATKQASHRKFAHR
jgi:acetyl-CoA C-acetyltransferase